MLAHLLQSQGDIPRQLSENQKQVQWPLHVLIEQQMETSIAQVLFIKAVEANPVLYVQLLSKQNTDHLSQLILLVGLRRDESSKVLCNTRMRISE